MYTLFVDLIEMVFFGSSIFYLEILLQSEYQSILFSATRNNNRQIVF